MTTPGATPADCAALWSNAFCSYAGAVIPASAAVAAAQPVLTAALTSAFGTPSALAAMDAAYTAAALTIAGGMLPAFTAVPPPTPIGWAALLATPYPATAAAAATKVANATHAWMLTGVATLVAPPFTVVTWT